MSGQVNFEVRHHDANRALFMVLLECAEIVIDIAAERDTRTSAVMVATNIRECRNSKMANREIADMAFRLAAELRPLTEDARAVQVKRILTHLTTADRWEAQIRNGG